MVKRLIRILLLGVLWAASSSSAWAIDFLMDWRPQAEQGGFYQAAEIGLYKDAGLDVTIRSGGPQSDPARLLAAGAVDAAMISNAFQAFNLMALEADVLIVMASFQKDPQILMVHGTSEAQGLNDLAGKPIFVGDATVGTFWQWLKARFGYSDSQIRKYNYSLAPWLVTPGAAQQGYITSEPFTAAQAGVEPRAFLLADEGYRGYAAMVAVRRSWAEENPNQVKAFVAANQRGWHEYITGDPTAANTRILRDNREMTPALLSHARAALVANNIVLTGQKGVQDVGWMEGARWMSLLREVSDLGLYPADLSLRRYLTSDFLLQNP